MNSLTDFGVFVLMISLTSHIIVSNIVSYSCGAVVSFVFNKYWTFSGLGMDQKKLGGLAKFVGLNLATLSFATGAIILFETWMTLPQAKVTSMVCAAVFSYLGMRFWVFRAPQVGK